MDSAFFSPTELEQSIVTHQSDPDLAVLVTSPIDIFGSKQAESSSTDDLLEEVKVGVSDLGSREGCHASVSRPGADGNQEDGPKKGTWW